MKCNFCIGILSSGLNRIKNIGYGDAKNAKMNPEFVWKDMESKEAGVIEYDMTAVIDSDFWRFSASFKQYN